MEYKLVTFPFFQADLTMALLLATSRRLFEANKNAKQYVCLLLVSIYVYDMLR